MTYRYVDEEKVLQKRLNGSFRTWLRRQPTAPHLVGRARAAEILGVESPHIARLQRQGRMPEPIPVEGTADVYVKEEVEALGRELKQERAERERRRKQKEKEVTRA